MFQSPDGVALETVLILGDEVEASGFRLQVLQDRQFVELPQCSQDGDGPYLSVGWKLGFFFAENANSAFIEITWEVFSVVPAIEGLEELVFDAFENAGVLQPCIRE